MVWLILVWSRQEDPHKAGRTILLLAYLMGLTTGLHLLNLLVLPFVALVVYFCRRTFSWGGFALTVGITLAVFLLIYKGVVTGLPSLAASSGPALVIALLIALLLATGWAVRRQRQNTGILLASLALVIAGYSTYGTVLIRSGQDPALDMNNPETFQQMVPYLERAQYGDWSLTDRARWTPETRSRYSSVGNFFWNYQVKKMYLRYFLWQFAGRGPSAGGAVSPFGANTGQDGVHWFQFGLPLALLLGLFGSGYHLFKDWKHGLAVLALFAATGLMLVLYLNQVDPQPRERDYSYAANFLAWSIWIGIGAAGVMTFIERKLRALPFRRIALAFAFIGMLVGIPGVMFPANYHEHDRTDNVAAWDFAFNMLNSCDQDSILFTNADNDTYPLWYLQEVEGIRKDVRVVNLSLLNTDWYITQLRDFEPRIPLALTDQAIAQMTPLPWQEKTVRLPMKASADRSGDLEWRLKPTFSDHFIRTQDRMVVQMLKDVGWTQPVYFAVTVDPEAMIGLDPHLEYQGLVFELRPEREEGAVNIDRLHHNLLEVYRYRKLDDPGVYLGPTARRLLQSLRTGFLQLVVDSTRKGERSQAREYLQAMAACIPEATIPITSKDLYFQVGLMAAQAGDPADLRTRLEVMPERFRLTLRDYLQMGAAYDQLLHDPETAEAILREVYHQYQQNGEVVGEMVRFYMQNGQPDQVVPILERWLDGHPQDHNARRLLNRMGDTLPG